MRSGKIVIAAVLLALGLNGCDLVSGLMGKDKENIDNQAIANEAVMSRFLADVVASAANVQKPDLSQLNRNDFNLAAVRLNLPIFWTFEETPSKEVTPANLVSLNFYPTSDSFVWKDEKGEFTKDFYLAYNQMVAVMKDSAFSAVSNKDSLLYLQWCGQNLDSVIEGLKDPQSSVDDKADWEAMKQKIAEHISAEIKKAQVDDAEKQRLSKVAEELDQGAVTLVASDFSKSDE